MKKSRQAIAFAALIASLAGICAAAAAESANGTVTYQSKSGPIVVNVKHAYLVKGPDVVSGKTIRRVVISVADVAEAIRKCERMMCSDGGIGEGMTVDLDAGPMLNYWFVANDQRVQFSGVAKPDSLKLTADAADHVAGKWDLDAHTGGGPVIHIEFDAPLVKEIKGKM